MTQIFYRALQWGLPIAMLIGAGSISPVLVLAMLATAWAAKRHADNRAALATAHANMRAYNRGRLTNDQK